MMDNILHAGMNLSLIENKALYDDLDIKKIWEIMRNALGFTKIPPLFLVKDILYLIQFRKVLKIGKIGSFYHDLLHRYKSEIIYKLINDRSILMLSDILKAKTYKERKFFIPFLIRSIMSRLMEIHSFAFDQDQILDSDTLAKCLELSLPGFSSVSSFFNDDQINTFRYIRDEQEEILIIDYSKTKRILSDIDTQLARKVRSTSFILVEVDDMRSPSMGGISGITTGGDLEKISSILPSEYAMMEQRSNFDIFDVNVLDNSLLSFTRDHYIDTRRYRDFYAVFNNPETLNIKPARLNFKYQHLFLSILFNIIGFYHRYFDIKLISLHFVFAGDTGSLDIIKLIDIVKKADFPNLIIDKKFCISSEELDDILKKSRTKERAVSYVFFQDNTKLPNEYDIPRNISSIYMKYGIDKERIDLRYKHKNSVLERSYSLNDYSRCPFCEFQIIPEEFLNNNEIECPNCLQKLDLDPIKSYMHNIRDDLFLYISGTAEVG